MNRLLSIALCAASVANAQEIISLEPDDCNIDLYAETQTSDNNNLISFQTVTNQKCSYVTSASSECCNLTARPFSQKSADNRNDSLIDQPFNAFNFDIGGFEINLCFQGIGISDNWP